MFDAALHEEGGSPVAVCRRRIFLIEAVNAPDALLRALGPFAVRQVPLDQVALVVVGATACIRIETSSLDRLLAVCVVGPDKVAARIERRLAGQPLDQSLLGSAVIGDRRIERGLDPGGVFEQRFGRQDTGESAGGRHQGADREGAGSHQAGSFVEGPADRTTKTPRLG